MASARSTCRRWHGGCRRERSAPAMKIDRNAWPPEKIASLDDRELKALRENAVRYEVADLAKLCEAELERRNPKRTPRVQKSNVSKRQTGVVVGYHFVCKGDRGVTLLPAGRFKSGSWVVSEEQVKRSLEYGAYLALHESKTEPSYRQGHIAGYELKERDMLNEEDFEPQTKHGVEFLVEATAESVPVGWRGDRRERLQMGRQRHGDRSRDRCG